MAVREFSLFFFLVSFAAAQGHGIAPAPPGPSFGSPSLGHAVRVRVNMAGGEACDVSTQVALMRSAIDAVAQAATGKSCEVEFFGIRPGNYYLSISGRGFASFDTGSILVSSPDTEYLEVTVPAAAARDQFDSALRCSSVTVKDLKVPKQAAKDFAKANERIEKQEWKPAIAELQKAIAIYPQYAAAYNNLGVVYARMGDRTRESEALHQAVDIDDGLAAAHVNLARVNLTTNLFADAETELTKAAKLDPTDGVTLVLLAYAQFMNHHLEDALASSQKVHAMRDVPHAFAHWVAAFALEQKNRIADAGSEFQAFVSEEPTGIRADAARKELVKIASLLSGK